MPSKILPFYAGASPAKHTRELPNPPAAYLLKIKESPYGRHCCCVNHNEHHDRSSMCEYAQRKYGDGSANRFVPKPELLDFVNTPLSAILAHIYHSPKKEIKSGERDSKIVFNNENKKVDQISKDDKYHIFDVNDPDIDGLFEEVPDLTHSLAETTLIDPGAEPESLIQEAVQIKGDNVDKSKADKADKSTNTEIISKLKNNHGKRDEHKEEVICAVSYDDKLWEIQQLIKKMKRKYCLCNVQERVWKRLSNYQKNYHVNQSETVSHLKKEHHPRSQASDFSTFHVLKTNSILHEYEHGPSRREFYRELKKAASRIE